MDRRILFLKKKISENLQKNYSIEELACDVNLSASHLQRLFKDETGISPVQYIRRLRMEKARLLLENTFLRVKQICFEVGMTDPSRFDRDFKQKYGLTPTAYRKLHWEKIQAEKQYGEK